MFHEIIFNTMVHKIDELEETITRLRSENATIKNKMIGNGNRLENYQADLEQSSRIITRQEKEIIELKDEVHQLHMELEESSDYSNED